MTLAREPGKGETEKRRGGGFRRPTETARAELARAASRYGFAEPEVLLRWPEIVGEALSGLCAPVKVTYPRDHGLAATLVVRSAGARATEVEHMGPRIVERVNQFYGYRAVGRIKVVQTTAPAARGFAEAPSAFAGPGAAAGPRDTAPPDTEPPDTEPPDTEPTATNRADAARLVGDFRDPGLRDALTRMGAYVLAKRDPKNPRT